MLPSCLTLPQNKLFSKDYMLLLSEPFQHCVVVIFFEHPHCVQHNIDYNLNFLKYKLYSIVRHIDVFPASYGTPPKAVARQVR